MKKLILALGAFALLSPHILVAQETGTLITRKAAQIDGNSEVDARRAAEDFGACLTDREKGRIAKLVDLAVDTKEYETVYKALYNQSDECLSDGTLRIGELALRGAIFQALYTRDYSSNSILSFPPEVKTGYRGLYPAELSDKARMYLSLENFGECVVRVDPNNVRLLVTSRVGSSTENEAFRLLMPRFSACIVKDNEIRFSRTNLKGFLAEGLYRLSRAATANKEGTQ